MLIANLAQAVQIPLWRWQATERSCRRLDEHRRDVVAAVHRAVTLQILGQISPGFWLAFHEFVLRQRRMAHVIHAGQAHAKRLPIVNHAGERNATHIHAVISALTADKNLPLALTACSVISKRHLHRAID